MLDRDFARACDPTLLARAVGVEPDPWQGRLLRKMPRRALVLAPRQSGKSTVCALAALWVAIYQAPAKIIIASPSQSQSQLMILTLTRLHSKLADAPGLVGESEKRVTFNNGSVIIAVHGDEKTIRGHSSVNFMILDESAGIKDELIAGLLPMLTVSQGSFWSIGTPKGLRGWFSEAWHAPESEYERIKVDASECPRLTESELKRLLKDLGPIQYRQEIGLDFLTDSDAAFSLPLIQACFTADVKPLFAGA
jgi:hypothetical protein